MAISLAAKVSTADGNSPVQTHTATSASYASGTRVLVAGHGLSDNHANGLGTDWADPTTNASSNSITWTRVALSAIDTSIGSTYRLQTAVWISSVLTATESFTITIDANSGGAANFYYGISTFEVSGASNTLAQAAASGTGTSSGTATLGSTPTGFQLLLGVAQNSHNDNVWDAAPSNFTAVSGATSSPVGGLNNSACSSTTDTDGATWGWTTAIGTPLSTVITLIELVDATTATLTQDGFRWGDDDGSESAHGWAAAEDTNLTGPLGSKLLRAQVNASGDPVSAAYTLRYQKNGAGGYVAVPTVASVAEVFGTVTYGALGTAANGSTSCTPSYPTGITAGQYLLCHVTSGNSGNGTPTMPGDWTQLGTVASTDGTYGLDTGPRRATVFGKVADGTESGTVTVSLTSGDTMRASISRWTKSAGDSWVVDAVTGHDSDGGTSVSVTFGSVNWHDGDAVAIVNAQRVDSVTQSAQSITATGITMGTRTNRASTAVTTGNDHRHVVDTVAAVSAADPSEDAAPTWSYTASAACSAAVVLVRLRGYSAAVTNQVYVSASANIAAGGEATTARLTAPSGKTTSDFTTGRRWDDENGTDSIDIGAEKYTEVEWRLTTQSPAAATDYFDFRVYAGSSPLDTYAVTPRWTIDPDIDASAGQASATAAAQAPAVNVAPNAGQASATATAHDATVSAGTPPGDHSVDAGQASATATAQQPAASVAPNAGQATATASAFQASIHVQPNAGQASATATGQQPSIGLAPNAGQAAATATAQQPSTWIYVNASTAAATAGAQQAAAHIQPAAGSAAATAAANTANANVAPTAGSASATATAHDATGSSSIAATAGQAAAIAVAWLASVALAVPAAAASSTATAHDATVGITNYGQAGEAAATATAHDATVRVAPNAGVAAATAAGQQPSVSVAINAGQAVVTVTGQQTAVGVAATAGEAAATAAAQAPRPSVAATAGQAAVSATAHQSSVPGQTDDFNRADASTLGAGWVDVAGTMGTISNHAYFGDSFGSGQLQRHRFNNTVGQADMYAKIDAVSFSTGGYSDMRVMARWSGTSFYELRIDNGGGWTLTRVVGATETDIASGSGLSYSLPETWTLEVYGTSPVNVRVLRDGAEVTTYQDSDATRITSGDAGGIGGYTAGGSPSDVTLDNYEQGQFVDTSVSVTAGEATATATAYQAAASVAAAAGVATATAAAQQPAPGVAPNAGSGSASAAAHDATVSAALAKWGQVTNDFTDFVGDNFDYAGSIDISDYVGGRCRFLVQGLADGLLRDLNDRDLTSSSVALLVEPNPDYGYIEFQLTQDNGATVVASAYKRADQSVLTVVYNGSTVATPTYDPATMGYWRWREDAGTLYFETGRNGVNYTTRWSSASAGTDFDLTQIEIRINGGGLVGGSAPDEQYAWVSKFNIVPAGAPAELASPAATAHDAYAQTLNAGDVLAQVATAVATAHFDTGTTIGLSMVADAPIELPAVAHDATVRTSNNPTIGSASATATAHNATVSTASQHYADAGSAAATATAHDATIGLGSGPTNANAGQAAATATAHNATITTGETRSANAGQAQATATAYDAVVQVGARPARINASATVYVPSIAKTVIAPIVNAVATIPAPTLRATSTVTPGRVNGLATVFVPGISMRANAPYFEATTTFFMPTPAEAQFVLVQVWNGTSWQSGVLNVWNGSEWKPGSLRVYQTGGWAP